MNFFKNNYWLFPFLLLSITLAVISYITSHFIISNRIIYNSLSNHLSVEKIEFFLTNRFKYEWLGYILNSLLILITLLITSVVIIIGSYLKSYKISFKKILNVVAWSNFIFLLPKIIRLFYFLINKDHQFTLDEYKKFNPFSLLYYINDMGITEKYLLYSLNLVNLFEFFYWLILAYGIKLISNLSYMKSLLLILQTYIVALIFWAIFITFIILNIS